MSCVLQLAVVELSDLLQTHANRDKVLCLASYLLKLCGSAWSRPALLQAAGRVAQARATARLLDDAALVKAMMAHGLGRQEGAVWGSLGALYHAFYLGYLQAEKAAWLLQVAAGAPGPAERGARVLHALCWTMFSTIGFVRSLRQLHLAAEEAAGASPRRCARARLALATLSSTKLLLDVLHTVSWLPRGWLWGGRLSGTAAGSLASASAALALVIHYRARALEAKEK